ncbi:preprotein translocase subunit YajC [Candidatus Bipolaricaulota sp. J31]
MPPEQGNQLLSLVILIVVFGAIFYFLIIRPQKKREREHRKLIQSLKRGDRVVTAGGIYGTIDKIDDDTVILSLEEGAKVRIAKSSIVEKIRK